MGDIETEKEKEEEIEVICGEYGKGGVFVDFMESGESFQNPTDR